MTGSTEGNRTKEFWNSRAGTFPRYEAGEHNYEANMLRLAREHGVDFRGKSVLDVGCGSGMYTLRLAMEAASVTAVDVSDEMLRILMRDAAAMGITNIRPVCSDWGRFTSDERFEIIFASMTPALGDDAAREKLLRHAGGQVIFIGFTRRNPSDVMEGLYARYGVTQPAFADAPQMRAWLEGRDIPYTALPVEGQWVVPQTREHLLEACAAMLRGHGAEPDMKQLADHIEAFRAEDGRYVEHTHYSIQMLLWRMD